MELKKLIIILSITITIIINLMFGVTYGWYAYSNAETTATGETIKEAPTIIFAQTEYISSSQSLPIYDEDRYNYANKNSFTVTIGENLKGYETGIEIALKDISIADELKIENYKYELLEDGKMIANGNFSTIDNNKELTLMPMTLYTPKSYPQTYTFELYIWLSDDNSNQNNLMGKEFSAKININSAVKK